MSVGLYLMTVKGEAVLEAALEARVEITHVTTAPASGMADDAHKRIEQRAKDAGVPAFVYAPPPDSAAGADWSIAAGWRRMLDLECLVVLHDSLLPRYRGFSPMVTALVNGEPELGATAFWAKPGLPPDTGPIVAQESLPIAYPIRAAEAIARLCPLYGRLTMRVLDNLARQNGQLATVEQDEGGASYSLFRDELDYRIDWQDARRVVRLVDAVSSPFPGAYAVTSEGVQVYVHRAVEAPDVRIEDRQPGKVLWSRDGHATVVCRQGVVQIVEWSSMDGHINAAIPTKTRFV
jgi:methionyl-tRNA formyltransferase